MYNADTSRLRAENQQLNGRLTQLEQLLSSLSTAPAQTADIVDKLVTDKDVEEYGDSLEVMRRVAKEERAAADRKIAELEQMLKQMQTSVLPKVEQVAHKQAVSAEQAFWSDLSMRVPDWKEINADSKFLDWLMEVDPLTGLSRQTYLEDAQRNMDVNRVVSFFSTWQGINGQSVAQPTRNAVASQLDKQVAPGRGRSSGAPTIEQSKMYSPKDIQKFFDDVRKGVYRGKEAERDRIERDIFAAQRENRIVANG
jgi:phage-related protein